MPPIDLPIHTSGAIARMTAHGVSLESALLLFDLNLRAAAIHLGELDRAATRIESIVSRAQAAFSADNITRGSTNEKHPTDAALERLIRGGELGLSFEEATDALGLADDYDIGGARGKLQSLIIEAEGIREQLRVQSVQLSG